MEARTRITIFLSKAYYLIIAGVAHEIFLQAPIRWSTDLGQKISPKH